MKKITYEWIGGAQGHWRVYVNGIRHCDCDKWELSRVIKEIEEEKED